MRNLLNDNEDSQHLKLEEEWQPIVGYIGQYEVSNHGNVRRLVDRIGRPRLKDIKPSIAKSGYARVFLCINGIVKTKYVHRLVATTFCKNQRGGNVVNHIDFNKANNRADNLELVSVRENVQHTLKNGRFNMGEKVRWSILTNDIVKKIRSEYVPYIVQVKHLADKYNIKARTVRAMLQRQSWKHI